MKIEVAKKDLEDAIQVVKIGTGAASAGNELMGHFVFRYHEGEMQVLAHNNRLSIMMPIQGCTVTDTDEHAAFTVESWRLNKWLSAVDAASPHPITLEYSDSTVTAKSSRGSVKFQSMDASTYPYGDKSFAETSKGVEIKAKRLHAALSHARQFISDKETTSPKLASTEILKGSLQATDKGALAVVTIKELEDSKIRIHGKDLGQVLAFIATCGDEMIELREHDRCLFLLRATGGGILSVGRPHHPFPEITLDKKPDDPYSWTMKVDDVKAAITALEAAAAKDDHRVNFSLEGGMVIMSVSTAMTGERSSQHIEAEVSEVEDPGVPMPSSGFDVAYPYLLKLLNQWRSETIKFGLNPQMDKKSKKPKGGYVRYREDRDGDDYLTLLVWLT